MSVTVRVPQRCAHKMNCSCSTMLMLAIPIPELGIHLLRSLQHTVSRPCGASRQGSGHGRTLERWCRRGCQTVGDQLATERATAGQHRSECWRTETRSKKHLGQAYRAYRSEQSPRRRKGTVNFAIAIIASEGLMALKSSFCATQR